MRKLLQIALGSLVLIGVLYLAFSTQPLPLLDKRVIGERCADGTNRC